MAENFLGLFGHRHDKQQGSPYILGRIVEVVYGPYLADGKTRNPDYNDITDLGKVRFVVINSSQYQESLGKGSQVAKPFFSFLHQYPLRDEYIFIMPGPGLDLNDRAGDIDYYYLPPIKLWGSPHHNASPDLVGYSEWINAVSLTYQNSQQGSNGNQIPKSIAYPLSYNFLEKNNIKSLIPFVGDVVLEGRWGQSIRLGSTQKEFSKFNTWSDIGENGNPIMILRNGQGVQSDKLGYTPTVEDVNINQSTIMLTAGQSISIDELSSFPFQSWNTAIKASTTSVVTLTTPPNSNTTLSANEQDASTLPQ